MRKNLLFLQLSPSVFFIRYSTCPLCPQADLRYIRHAYVCYGYRCTAKHFAGQAGILRFVFQLLCQLLRNFSLILHPCAKNKFKKYFIGFFIRCDKQKFITTMPLTHVVTLFKWLFLKLSG